MSENQVETTNDTEDAMVDPAEDKVCDSCQ